VIAIMAARGSRRDFLRPGLMLLQHAAPSMSKASRTIEIMEDYGGAGSVVSVKDGPVIDQDGAPSTSPHSGLQVTRHGLDMASRPVTTQEVETIRRLLGVSVVDEDRKLSAVVASIDTVREQTGRMVDAGVHIGRVLNDVHEVLSQEGFARAPTLRPRAPLGLDEWQPVENDGGGALR